jgi:hypothetical protein
LGIAPESQDRARQRPRPITKRNPRRRDEWIRRKPRRVRLEQCERTKAIADFRQGLGVPEWRAWRLAPTGKGWWRMALGHQATEAPTLAWLVRRGLVHAADRYLAVETDGYRRGT